MAKKVRCKCGYEWTSKSLLEFVTCPSCQKKVKISKKENKVEELKTLAMGGKNK